jgi:hypothetical protein
LVRCLILTAALCVHTFGQSPAAASAGEKNNAVVVRAVAVQQEEDGSALEITSNGTLVPTITKLDGPLRLVIDLPGAINTVRRQLGAVAKDIRGVRVNQFQQNPPITRVVIDLAQPRNYFWEMVQDKLMVHLRPLAEAESEAAAAAGAPAPTFTQGVEASGSSSNVAGNAVVMLAGSRITPGSSITAGEETAILTLSRGGQVRVCPGTTVSVTTSPNGRDLMLGISTGALEAHYQLANSADSILTPDFRILLTGPGEFHYAFSADAKGNTCVRGMAANTASAVVSELIGNGTYQVKADEQVVFRGGQLGKIDRNVPTDCGCPRGQAPVLRAEAPEPAPVAQEAAAAPPKSSNVDPQDQAGAPPVSMPIDTADVNLRAAASAETAPLPALKPNEQRVVVEAPLVFRASDPPPTPIRDARKLPTTSRRATTEMAALPPVPPLPQPSSAKSGPGQSRPQSQSRGFFGSIKHFFSKMFG